MVFWLLMSLVVASHHLRSKRHNPSMYCLHSVLRTLDSWTNILMWRAVTYKLRYCTVPISNQRYTLTVVWHRAARQIKTVFMKLHTASDYNSVYVHTTTAVLPFLSW